MTPLEMPPRRRRALIPHPDTPCPVLTSVHAGAALTADALVLSYILRGDLTALRLPEAAPGERIEGLWRHTCCEAFLMAEDGGYREFNFAPSGAWQAYEFRTYRDGGPLADAPAPGIVCRLTPGRLTLTTRLPRAALPAGSSLRLGLTAVIETPDGGLSYWALRHAAGKPDFHHTHAFALKLRPTPDPS